jgi:hypothetical protein
VSDDEEAAEEGTAAEIPEQDFEATEAEAEVDEGTTTASFASIVESAPIPSMLPPPVVSRRTLVVEDTSTAIPHPRIFAEPDKFEMALGLWCENIGVSREQYKSLREILLLLQQDPTMASNLPKSLKTLKRHVNGQLPLLAMRKKDIALSDEKLPTQTALTKSKGDRKPREITEPLFFFDAKALFQAFLNSDLVSKMYFGIGQFRDDNTETEILTILTLGDHLCVRPLANFQSILLSQDKSTSRSSQSLSQTSLLSRVMRASAIADTKASFILAGSIVLASIVDQMLPKLDKRMLSS